MPETQQLFSTAGFTSLFSQHTALVVPPDAACPG